MPGLNRPVIANLESGRRDTVSVDEAFVLAAALDVPPPLLLLPLESGNSINVTPRTTLRPHHALVWLRGDEALATGLDGPDEHVRLQDATRVRRYLDLHEHQEDVRQAQVFVQRAEYTGDDEDIQRSRRAAADALIRLHEHVRLMQSEGARVPPLPAREAELMEQLGLSTTGIPTDDSSEERGS